MRSFALALSSVIAAAPAFAQSADWRADAPGTLHRIGPDLPPPGATRSAGNPSRPVPWPEGATPHVPAGFAVSAFATGLDRPRVIRVAPNGDIFVAESTAGRIRVLRAPDGAPAAQRSEVFASGLDRPFGIAFYPPGPAPDFVYVATNTSVLRFAYRTGDLAARSGPETVVARLSPTSGHHWTRDLAFSPNGARLFVSVGSGSNDADDMPPMAPDAIARHEAQTAPGAAWGNEDQRADVLAFSPTGGARSVYAAGLRNCSGLAIQPATGTPWCAVNERDGLGDDLPPDYATSVRQGGFYGWPWFYIGAHPDPAHAGQRPDLAGRVIVPDVLIQAHSAPLGIAFYDGAGPAAFPAGYRGDAFVTLHGSWNRSLRTGYKVIRIPMKDGVPTGRYEDFLTGFVADDGGVWGRPVGVAVARDGALLVSEDANGTIWRITPAD